MTAECETCSALPELHCEKCSDSYCGKCLKWCHDNRKWKHHHRITTLHPTSQNRYWRYLDECDIWYGEKVMQQSRVQQIHVTRSWPGSWISRTWTELIQLSLALRARHTEHVTTFQHPLCHLYYILTITSVRFNQVLLVQCTFHMVTHAHSTGAVDQYTPYDQSY